MATAVEVAPADTEPDAYGDDGFEADEVVPVTDATAAAAAAADAAVEEGENSHITAALGSPVLRTRRQSADEQRNTQQLMFAKRLASGQACVSAQADLMSKGLFGAQLAARQVGGADSANGDDENNNANANANASRSARGASGNGGTSSTRRRDVLHSLARPKRRMGGGAGGGATGGATADKAAAHAFSNDDDRRNCVFVPRKSKQAQRAMRVAGYDFANKAPEVGDVAVRCHRDAGAKAKKLEERRGEEDYNARQDRKRCPSCQAFQSYKEHQEKRKKCQNCSVEYQGGLTWGECGNSFLGRMSRGHAKLAKAKADKATAVLAAQTRPKVPKSLYQKALEERLAQAEAAAHTAADSSGSGSGGGALASSTSADSGSAFLRRMDDDLSRRARRLSVLEVQQQQGSGGAAAMAAAAAAAAAASSGSAADAKAAAIATARAAWSASSLAPASGARAAPPHARASRSGGGGGGGGLSANALAPPPPMPPPPPRNAPASHTAAWQRFQRLSSHVYPRAHGPDDPLSVDELRVRVAEASLSIGAASHRLCKDEIDRLLHRADRDGSGAIRKAAYEAEVRAAYGPATWAEEGGAFKPEGAAAAAAYKEQLRLNRRRDLGTIGGQASAAAATASSAGGGSASCPAGAFRLQLVYVKRHGRPAVVPASAWGGAVIGSGTTVGELRSRLWESRALFGFPCDRIVALHADAHASSRLHDSIGLGSSLLQRHAGTTVVFLLERE